MSDQQWKIRQEKRMSSKVHGIFTKQRKWVVKNMQDLSFFNQNSLNIQKNTIDDEIEAFIRQLPYKNELATEIQTFIRFALKKGGDRIVKDLNMSTLYGITFSLSNPRAQQFLDEKRDWEASDAPKNLDGVTKTRLKEVLSDAHRTGQNYTDTAERITQLSDAGVFSLERGKLIAVREIGVAYEEGNAEIIEEFKGKFPGRQVLKSWRTVGDSRVTLPHRANESDGWIDSHTRFSGTGDMTAPGSDNPRCRCSTRYDIPQRT